MMGQMTRKSCILLFIFFLCHCLYSESGIGKIITVKGEVRIDRLGTGIFVDAREKDTIYMKTRIKTGNQGTALVLIMEKEKELYPGIDISGEELYHETRISGFVELKDSFYSACIDFLAFLFPGEKIEPCGFKDEDVFETIDKGITWQNKGKKEQKNPSSYALAIAKKEYVTALILLDEKRELSVSPTELGLLKGFCYFQLQHYDEAYRFFHRADLSSRPDSSGTLKKDRKDSSVSASDRERYAFYNTVLFQKCLAAYVTGRKDEAREQLAELLDVSMDKALAAGLRELEDLLQNEGAAQ